MKDLTDDLIMEVAVLEKDLRDTRISVSKAESMLADFDTRLARQRLIFKATLDALINLIGSPVISLSEYRSLRSGLRISTKELEDLEKKQGSVKGLRNKDLARIPVLARQLQEAEDRLDQYEPPRTVLEFPRRDQQ